MVSAPILKELSADSKAFFFGLFVKDHLHGGLKNTHKTGFCDSDGDLHGRGILVKQIQARKIQWNIVNLTPCLKGKRNELTKTLAEYIQN